MFKREIEQTKGRAEAAKNYRRGLARLRERKERLNRFTAELPALEAKIQDLEWRLNITESWAFNPTMLHVAAYLYLCGENVWAPSLAHMKSVGRALPAKSKALANCLEDAIALGWASLDATGRFLWTTEGKVELAALRDLHAAQFQHREI